VTFFKDLGGSIFQSANIESEYFNKYNDFDMPSTVYHELDKSIELCEIVYAVKLLKRNKAYGDDNLLNEYFIESIDILSPLLCTMFNNIIDSGYFPEIWTNGVIIPQHKKVLRLMLIIIVALRL